MRVSFKTVAVLKGLTDKLGTYKSEDWKNLIGVFADIFEMIAYCTIVSAAGDVHEEAVSSGGEEAQSASDMLNIGISFLASAYWFRLLKEVYDSQHKENYSLKNITLVGAFGLTTSLATSAGYEGPKYLAGAAAVTKSAQAILKGLEFRNPAQSSSIREGVETPNIESNLLNCRSVSKKENDSLWVRAFKQTVNENRLGWTTNVAELIGVVLICTAIQEDIDDDMARSFAYFLVLGKLANVRAEAIGVEESCDEVREKVSDSACKLAFDGIVVENYSVQLADGTKKQVLERYGMNKLERDALQALEVADLMLWSIITVEPNILGPMAWIMSNLTHMYGQYVGNRSAQGLDPKNYRGIKEIQEEMKERRSSVGRVDIAQLSRSMVVNGRLESRQDGSELKGFFKNPLANDESSDEEEILAPVKMDQKKSLNGKSNYDLLPEEEPKKEASDCKIS